MENNSFNIFALLPLILSLSLAENAADICGRGIFKLALFGRMQDDEQWNTTYHLERSSCKSTKNWNLLLYQNITEIRKVQKIHLHGHFTSNFKDPDAGGMFPLELANIQVDNSSRVALENNHTSRCKDAAEESKIKIVSRHDWNARRQTEKPKPLVHPVTMLDVYSTGPACSNHSDCVIAVQTLQDTEMLMYGDIYANFLSAGDGRIYEGTGWDQSWDGELNLKFLGDGSNPPSPQQMASFAVLIREGVKRGKISEDYKFSRDEWGMSKSWISWLDNI